MKRYQGAWKRRLLCLAIAGGMALAALPIAQAQAKTLNIQQMVDDAVANSDTVDAFIDYIMKVESGVEAEVITLLINRVDYDEMEEILTARDSAAVQQWIETAREEIEERNAPKQNSASSVHVTVSPTKVELIGNGTLHITQDGAQFDVILSGCTGTSEQSITLGISTKTETVYAD